MQGYPQAPQATPVHPSIQAIHTVLPPPQQPNVFSRPEVITSRRIGPTAVIVSNSCIFHKYIIAKCVSTKKLTSHGCLLDKLHFLRKYDNYLVNRNVN